ncbi:MAG: hypothetical protein EOP83_05090 [Verrucomicrobiaceae bacterium]|nr:MAG: hypothetical protein EOP83_05090 [Verrucomicrobiaceae bacterium]
MIHVVASHEGPNTVLYITREGSFNRRIPTEIRLEMTQWMFGHWGQPNEENAWEFYDQIDYMTVRLHDPDRAVELRMRWHGVEC